MVPRNPKNNNSSNNNKIRKKPSNLRVQLKIKVCTKLYFYVRLLLVILRENEVQKERAWGYNLLQLNYVFKLICFEAYFPLVQICYLIILMEPKKKSQVLF